MQPEVTTLVVDDQASVRVSLVRLLEQHGHRCYQVVGAPEARQRIAERDFDLVLCDANMTGRSGLDFIEFVLDAMPGIAVVIVADEDDPTVTATAIDAGAYGYLVKPFTPNEVLVTVANALRRSKLELEHRAQGAELVETIGQRTEDLWNTIHRLERADSKVKAGVEELVRRMSLAAELRDQETFNHIERMSRYCQVLAQVIGLDDERCGEILLASRLHDVGKIGVPDRILRKRGRFTPAEFEIMKQHADEGYRLLAGTGAALLQMAASIAWTHHERWDGTGYPRGLKAEEIPIEGRIAAVADCFDALMSKRPYKPALPLGQVVRVMREGRGTQFDPELLDAFLNSLDRVVAVTHEVTT